MVKIFEWIVEGIGWLRIVASPLFIGLLLGAGTYYFSPNKTGIIIGVIFIISGLITGIIWANKMRKKQGTNRFLSRIIATPDLDEKNSEGK